MARAAARRARAGLLLACLACACAGAAGDERAPASLYASLGGSAGIDDLVDRFLRELADDRRIAHHFADTDVARLRRNLSDQLCEISGGPCRYTGDPMADVHRGMGIREGDFNALVEDLIAAMDGAGLGTGVQNQLLARLAPMRGDIVEGRRERRAREAARGPVVGNDPLD
jgi:hemoglobin